MKNQNLINLTSKLYDLTVLFPKKDHLRYKMRELADGILANLVLISEGVVHQSKDLIWDTQKDLEILNCFFEVVKTQNWVKESQLLEIQDSYNKIYNVLEKFSGRKPSKKVKKPSLEKPPVENSKGKKGKLKSGRKKLKSKVSAARRQKKILEVLKQINRAQVSDLKQVFPNVTKRTIRRDLDCLLKKDLIVRKGKRNETYYKLH